MIFDTLEYADELKAVGFTDSQAKVHANALKKIVENDLATKQDLMNLEERMNARMGKQFWMLIAANGSMIATATAIIVSVMGLK